MYSASVPRYATFMSMKYIDLHQDLKLSIEKPQLLDADHLVNPQTNFEKLEQNNVSIVFCTGFPMPEDMDFFKKENFSLLLEDALWYESYAKEHPEWILVQSESDVDACIDGSKRGLLFHLEGVNMFTGEGDDWNTMSKLYDKGMRSLALTWSKTNALCGGNDDPTVGVTELGHKMIDWVLERNMVLDLAHISRQGFMDVAQKYDIPLFVSHGAVDELNKNNRNYTDDQLRLIGESGGCIGVFFSQQFLCGQSDCSFENAVAHITHIRSVAGIDAVAMGSDFGGVVSGTPAGLSSLDDLGNLMAALRASGWSDSEYEQFAYKNAKRVIKSYLK